MNALVLMMALQLASGALVIPPDGSRLTAPGAAALPPVASAPARRVRQEAMVRRLPGVRFDRSPALVPPHDEILYYDIRYGILGSIGSLRIASGALAPRSAGASAVRVQGEGSGSVLGVGGMQSRIDAEFDSGARGSLRWTAARGDAGAERVDTGRWDVAGQAHLLRHRAGHPDEAYNFRTALQTSDPLGAIWRLRTAPPPLGASDIIQVVDGLAMWRVRVTTIAAVDPVPGADRPVTALRLEGDIAPYYYDGRPDPDRKTRRFTMWLDRRPGHRPLLIAVPFGPANVLLRLVDAGTAVADTDRRSPRR